MKPEISLFLLNFNRLYHQPNLLGGGNGGVFWNPETERNRKRIGREKNTSLELELVDLAIKSDDS